MSKLINALCLIAILAAAFAGTEGTAKNAKRGAEEKAVKPAKAPATVENKWRKARPMLDKPRRTPDFSRNAVKEFLEGKRNSLNGYDAL